MEVINWKENKEVGTICFEVASTKKPKIFMEFFYVSFQIKLFIFGFNHFILEENKIFMEALLYHQKATEK